MELCLQQRWLDFQSQASLSDASLSEDSFLRLRTSSHIVWPGRWEALGHVALSQLNAYQLIRILIVCNEHGPHFLLRNFHKIILS